MLTTGEVITYCNKFWINAGSNTAQYNTPLRERSWFFLTDLAKRAWNLAPNWWKQAYNGQVSLPASASSASMPTNFSNFGPEGQVYLSGFPYGPLEGKEPDEIQSLRRLMNQPQIGRPLSYSLFDRSANGTPLIQVWPSADIAYTLLIDNYTKKMPDLVDYPGAVTATVTATAGNPNGAYTYKATFVTPSGETEAGVVSASVTAVSFQIAISGIPVSMCRSVTARKIYRTVASGSSYLLAGTISDNVTTTFTDNVADGSLGAAAPTPSEAITGTEQYPDDMIERIFVTGLRAPLGSAGGDLRDAKWEKDWEKDIKRFWGEFKQGDNMPQRVPRFGMRGSPAFARSSYRYRFGQ